MKKIEKKTLKRHTIQHLSFDNLASNCPIPNFHPLSRSFPTWQTLPYSPNNKTTKKLPSRNNNTLRSRQPLPARPTRPRGPSTATGRFWSPRMSATGALARPASFQRTPTTCSQTSSLLRIRNQCRLNQFRAQVANTPRLIQPASISPVIIRTAVTCQWGKVLINSVVNWKSKKYKFKSS